VLAARKTMIFSLLQRVVSEPGHVQRNIYVDLFYKITEIDVRPNLYQSLNT